MPEFYRLRHGNPPYLFFDKSQYFFRTIFYIKRQKLDIKITGMIHAYS
ncbi:hypothetical protein [Candidatus Methylobacter favarea]|nr:hypothetical protein [Candidatus Methylobacter favarea]